MQVTSRPRPLSFVGHSLGGLVIKEVGDILLQYPPSIPPCQCEALKSFAHPDKQAFVQMTDSRYAKILEATDGCLFFGVPNLGIATESLVPMVGD